MGIQVQIDSYLDKVDSKYALVQVAAKRARQINDYYHYLGEGMHTYEDFTPPLIESHTKNYLSLALEEIAANKIRFEYAPE
jgi:DNA-directed RNA polymerase subunit omega